MSIFKKKEENFNNNLAQEKPISSIDIKVQINASKRKIDKQLEGSASKIKELALLATQYKGTSNERRAREDLKKTIILDKQLKTMRGTLDLLQIENSMENGVKSFLGTIKDTLDIIGTSANPSLIEDNAKINAEISNIIASISGNIDEQIIIENTVGADTQSPENIVSDDEVDSIIMNINSSQGAEKSQIDPTSYLTDEKWKEIKANISQKNGVKGD
ncbi:MAG: hypothetical protein RRY78_05795 [Clostridia bacterium]